MNRATFLIPHFNNPQGLVASLASVGTAELVDAVIVDDGSVRAPIDEAQCRAAWRAQGELKFYYLPHNCGIEYALNTGLEAILAAGYEFVARLDCDDLCVSDRIARQVAFLDQYPEVYLLGSAVTFFDASGDRFTLKQPQTHAEIVTQMHKDNAFTHPSVMFRTKGVREIGLYPMDCKAAEDFAYFWQFVDRYQTANLAEVLTKSEYNDSGISMSRRRQQQAMRIKILARYFDWRPQSALNIAKATASFALPVSFTRKIKRLLGVGTWN
ncbi:MULTISPECIES: glycosyltransferase [Deefgea]|uniref:Glycosyltransferase n=1 Tax=Deefgea chitinilytica TaxID=570276 RepID=A0ABS2CEG0_9NEIS|nr:MULTISPECIES: glycosyltransferase [Deefgea]MBM5571776.1 glycosyltransferase [Deefgea chitinilytica]MBM9889011.1 glycosyltransferase [Deefgea sp. CFH1-16]